LAKVTINGEVFSFDLTRKPMSEALAIEHALGCRYADWETDMLGGSARALCGFIWLVWRRDGRDTELADILSGKVDIDLGGLEVELEPGEPGYEDQQGEGGGTGPTIPAPEATNTTGGSTSPRSANLGSGRGKSASSTSPSSKVSST
jgi:hypothetical protein